jgi:hypothetical protein
MGRSKPVDSKARNEQRTATINRRARNWDNHDHAELARREEALDEALKNTFPASDPISIWR